MEHHIALKCCHKSVPINVEGWSLCVAEWGWTNVVHIIYWGGESLENGDHNENPKTGCNKINFKLSLKSKIMGDF